MIVRILDNNRVVIVKGVDPTDEYRWMRHNRTGGFMKVDSLPESVYDRWLWDGENIVVDVLAEMNMLAAEVTATVHKFLDETAMKYRYDNILSCRSYVGMTNSPFHAEASALANWSSDCWMHVGTVEYMVRAGLRTMPTVDEMMAELPPLGEIPSVG